MPFHEGRITFFVKTLFFEIRRTLFVSFVLKKSQLKFQSERMNKFNDEKIFILKIDCRSEKKRESAKKADNEWMDLKFLSTPFY